MALLGELTIRNFIPQTAVQDKRKTLRKRRLRDAFVDQNPHIRELQAKCKGNPLELEVIFYLNTNVSNKISYKKDLDKLLKILMDVVKEQMNDAQDEDEGGLGLLSENRDEDIFKITCRKELVKDAKDEGITLRVSQYLDITQ